MMDVRTTECPRCNRVWPVVSEQGLHTTEYHHCYHCMLTWISLKLEELRAEVDYTIETCYVCAGIEEKRLECKRCETKGWIAEEKE